MVRCEPRDPRTVGAPPALLRWCADRPPVSSPALLFSLTEHRLRVVARVIDVKQGARDEGVHEGVVQLAQVVEDLGGRAWGARERGRGAFFFFPMARAFRCRGEGRLLSALHLHLPLLTLLATSAASSRCSKPGSSALASTRATEVAISNQKEGTHALRPRSAAADRAGSGSDSRASRPAAEVAVGPGGGGGGAPVGGWTAVAAMTLGWGRVRAVGRRVGGAPRKNRECGESGAKKQTCFSFRPSALPNPEPTISVYGVQVPPGRRPRPPGSL